MRFYITGWRCFGGASSGDADAIRSQALSDNRFVGRSRAINTAGKACER
jgi:hypothetical protein